MKTLLTLTLCIMYYCGWSQLTDQTPPLNSPTAPAAYEFLKYGDIPFSEYTGKANISIPIYNINLDAVNIPLALNYNTGGIKVNQEAGIVGLGWDFMLPAIVQTVQDRDDYDRTTLFQKLPDYVGNPALPSSGPPHPAFSIPGSIQDGDNFFGSTNYIDQPLYYKASGDFIVSEGKYRVDRHDDLVSNSFTGRVDSEPDIFTLNLNGVEIVMTTTYRHYNTNVASMSSPMDLEIINGRNEYEVEVIENTSNVGSLIHGIKVTDPSSNIYFFDQVDVMLGFSTSASVYLAPLPGGTNSENLPNSKIYRLTKIITDKKQEVTFDYSTTNIEAAPKISHEYYRRRGSTSSYQVSHFGLPLNVSAVNTISTSGTSSHVNYFNDDSIDALPISTTIHYSSGAYSYCTSITTPNEQIELNYSSRSDYTGMKKLDEIIIKNHISEPIKDFQLDYRYFTSPDDATNAPGGNHRSRLKLITVQELGKNPYRFTYNDNIPRKDSFNIDYWGYANGHVNSSLIPSLVALGYPQYNDMSGNNFEANLTYTQGGSLLKVEYPTGGTTEFTYELHEFDGLFVPNPNITQITQGGGIRIKTLKNFDNNGDLTSHLEYKYYGGKNMSPRKMTSEIFTKVHIYNWLAGPNPPIHYSRDTPVLRIFNNNFITANVTGEGEYIGYDYVDVIRKGSADVGYTRKYFKNEPNEFYSAVDGYFNPVYVRERDELKNGTLTLQKDYNENDELVRSIEYRYKIIGNKNTYKNHYGVKSKGDGTGLGFILTEGRFLINVNIPYFQLTFYPIYANTSLLEEQIIQENFDSNSIVNTIEYVYDTHNRISREILTNNVAGQDKKVETRYSYSFLKYIQPYNIQTRQYENSTSYNIKNEKWFNYSIHSDKNNAILLNESWDCNRQTYPPSSDLCDESTFTYDIVGNVIEYTAQDQITTSIIYGYNKRYPIAKIENATYQEIASNLGISETTLKSYTENNLSAIEGLRQSMPNAMVTTYVHKPLVGIISMTDPRGYITSYEYDDANRLKRVKDADGKIISENEYHYKGQ